MEIVPKLLSSSHAAHSICLKRQGGREKKKGKKKKRIILKGGKSFQQRGKTIQLQQALEFPQQKFTQVWTQVAQKPMAASLSQKEQDKVSRDIAISDSIKLSTTRMQICQPGSNKIILKWKSQVSSAGGPGSLGSFRIYLPRKLWLLTTSPLWTNIKVSSLAFSDFCCPPTAGRIRNSISCTKLPLQQCS